MSRRPNATTLGGAVGCLLGAALVITSPAARADGAGDKAMAQTLFERGRELVQEKRFAEACPTFAQSLRLDPGIGTKLWLADCYENNGQTASAWVLFKEAGAAAALEHDARASVARRRAAGLESRLVRLVIAVPSESQLDGLVVMRDGVTVDSVELGIASPLDPGVHTLSATAPGRKTWTHTFELRSPSDIATVTVPELAETAPAATPTPAPAPAPAPASSVSTPTRGTAVDVPAAPSAGWSTARIAGAGLAGAGLVSLGAGALLGLSAKATYAQSNRDGHCLPTNECDDTGKSLRARASSVALGSTLAFGAGAAAATAGVILFIAAPRRTATATSVVPVVTGSALGVELTRTW